jgi:hypothetical protein
MNAKNIYSFEHEFYPNEYAVSLYSLQLFLKIKKSLKKPVQNK